MCVQGNKGLDKTQTGRVQNPKYPVGKRRPEENHNPEKQARNHFQKTLAGLKSCRLGRGEWQQVGRQERWWLAQQPVGLQGTRKHRVKDKTWSRETADETHTNTHTHTHTHYYHPWGHTFLTMLNTMWLVAAFGPSPLSCLEVKSSTFLGSGPPGCCGWYLIWQISQISAISGLIKISGFRPWGLIYQDTHCGIFVPDSHGVLGVA